jgi:hypothetical protein
VCDWGFIHFLFCDYLYLNLYLAVKYGHCRALYNYLNRMWILHNPSHFLGLLLLENLFRVWDAISLTCTLIIDSH